MAGTVTEHNGSDEVSVVFRADASVSLGGGHVQRCLTLAEALHARGRRCGFAVNRDAAYVVPALRERQYPMLELDGTEPDALRARWPRGVEWLVVDHYERDAALERACRPWARRILAIDDLADRAHDCDGLLDQTLGRAEADYRQRVPPHCRLLLGPAYALLRPQFAQARAGRRRYTRAARRVLVSLGATDAPNATNRILEMLRTTTMRLELDIVLGSAAPHLAAVRATAASLPMPSRVHTDVKDMATLMAQADLAVGAAGTTSWERCCLGLPSVLLVTADNQRAIAAALQAAAAASVCGELDTLDPAAVLAEIERLCADDDARLHMGINAARICDGAGADRVAEWMAA